MATYKEIFGKPIKVLASDPTDAGAEGQIWYNTALDNFRTILNSAAWASCAPMLTARNAIGSTGIQTAALSVGGQTSGYLNTVEEYNGSGWETGTVYPLSIQGPFVTGTVTAAVVTGGHTHPPGVDRTETFEYDGTTWSPTGALPAGRRALNSTGFGSQTAAVQSGGLTPGGVQNTSNEYDGSTWTAGNTINTKRYTQGGAGSLTAGVIAGGVGVEPSYTDLSVTEEYDGTNWTSVTSMTTAVGQTASSNQGSQTSMIVFGGGNPDSNRTEAYDGTNWSTGATLATARTALGGAGASSTSGLGFGGYVNPTTSSSTLTEEYNVSTNALTAAAWASAPNLNTGRDSLSGGSGAGTQTAALCFTGRIPGPAGTLNSEEYNGTAWAEGLNYPAVMNWVMGVGTQTAALGFNGQTLPPGINQNTSNLYNGTTWTAAPATNDTGRVRTGFGTSTAAIAACGSQGEPIANSSESFDGSSWTNEPNTNASAEGRGSAAGSPQGAGLIFGGSAPSDGYQAETWDGSSWTEVGNLLIEKRYFSGFGISTACTGVAGGLGGSNPTVTTQSYDGTNWSTSVNIITSRMSIGNAAAAPSTAGMVYGGAPSFLTSAEVFDEETTALNYKTITTS